MAIFHCFLYVHQRVWTIHKSHPPTASRANPAWHFAIAAPGAEQKAASHGSRTAASHFLLSPNFISVHNLDIHHLKYLGMRMKCVYVK